MNFKYVISYGGGIGPDVWDAEHEVEANDIKDGLEKTISTLDNDDTLTDYHITSIEQVE